MDVREYIESGILEQYVLCEASDQERREVDCLSKIYPEIKAALSQCEEDFESLSRKNAVAPPRDLKSTIMAELQKHSPEAQKEPSATLLAEKSNNIPKKSTWPVIWAAAASLSLIIAFWQYLQMEKMQVALEEFEEGRDQLLANNEYLRGEVEFLTEDVQQTFDPTYAKIVLDPTEGREGVSISMIWQPETGKVKINLAPLPELPEDRQYQLWVWKEGVPKDMGILPKEFSDVYLSDKLAAEGDAFAITIEPLGGLPDPSLDQIAFYGKV
ncbi:MAG: anti-sigma factor [Flavobacteriales bacterium]|nr:anti-sigma factor [Flavobacteriales bacterium]